MNIAFQSDFACAPEELFSWLDDPQMAMRWQKGVKSGEILRATPERIGTTFREVMEDESGRLEMLGVITEYAAGRTIAFHLDSRIHRVDVRYSVDAHGRRSRLNVQSEIHWKFPMSIVCLFMGSKIKAGILAQMEAEAGELRKLCAPEKGRASLAHPPPSTVENKRP